MELNYQTLLFIILTSSIATKQASCIRFSFIFHGKPSISFPPFPSPSPSPSSSTSPSTITSLLDDLKEPAIHVPQEVKNACKKTDFHEECVSSIANLVLVDKVEPLSIFDAVVKAFGRALEAAREEISSPSRVINVENSTLSTCEEMYENAREDVQKATNLIATNVDKYGVSIRLSAALTFVETCDDAFPQEIKGEESHLFKKTNRLLLKLAHNCLALADSSNSDDEF